MTTKVYSVPFAGGESIRLPQGIYFYVMDAPAGPLTIQTEGVTVAPLLVESVPAGVSYGPVTPDKKWKNLLVTSAAAQTVRIAISDDAEFKAANAVTVVGTVSAAEVASTTLTSPNPTTVATGGSQSIAANTNRRKIHIGNPSTQTASLWIVASNAASPRGVELQPGTTFTLQSTAQIFVRNDSGGNLDFTYLEET